MVDQAVNRGVTAAKVKSGFGTAVKIAALAVITLQYAKSFSTPALGQIMLAFPDVSPETIKQIESLPSLMAIPAAFSVGILERFMSKKAILWIAMLCTLIGGIAPAFLGSISTILVARVLLGIGRGMIFPMASSFIADLFTGKERDQLMGYKSAVGSLSGVAFQMIGGALAVLSWRYAFIGYAFIIPIILLIAFKLPEPEVKPLALNSGKSQMTLASWVIIVLASVFNIFQFSIFTNLAIAVTTTKLGTPALSGNLLSMVTLASAVAAAIFGRFILGRLKNMEIPLSILFEATGFLVFTMTHTPASYFVGAALFGVGFGIFNVALIVTTVKSVPRESATLTLSLLAAFQNGGQYLSSFALKALAVALGFSGALAGWNVSWRIMYVAAILLAVGILILNRRPKISVVE